MLVVNNYREIFNWLDNVININFTEVASGGQIIINKAEISGYAYAYYPTTSDIYLDYSYDYTGGTNGFQNGIGSHGWCAFVHELGHALGLKHSFDAPLRCPPRTTSRPTRS